MFTPRYGKFNQNNMNQTLSQSCRVLAWAHRVAYKRETSHVCMASRINFYSYIAKSLIRISDITNSS